jgi:sterol desaturase/sphingolipid hydroxylase (fatty acid hydroxylase superfamily)
MALPFLVPNEARISALIIGCGILWVIEALAPLYQFRPGRLRRSLPNFGLTLTTVALNLLAGVGAAALVAWSSRHGVGLLPKIGLAPWAQLAVGIVVLDFAAYWAHVLLHRIPFGWRLHRVHHSEPEVDVTTALRQHPGETIWRLSFQLATTIALGAPLWVVVLYLMASTANAQLEHANVRLPERLDRMLRLVFVTPNMHKTHHSRAPQETDTNYANLLSVWDRLFATYTPQVDFGRLRYGLDGFDAPQRQSFVGLLRLPFARHMREEGGIEQGSGQGGGEAQPGREAA